MSGITKTHRLIWASAAGLIVLFSLFPPIQSAEYHRTRSQGLTRSGSWIDMGHHPIWQIGNARVHVLRLACEVLAVTGLAIVITLLDAEISGLFKRLRLLFVISVTNLLKRLRRKRDRSKSGHALPANQAVLLAELRQKHGRRESRMSESGTDQGDPP